MVLVCVSTFIFIVDPLELLIDNVRGERFFRVFELLMRFSTRQQLEIRKGSYLYSLWEKPPLPVIMQVFLFNITNAEAFLSGVDKKLKVVEIGPYVYQ